MAEVEQRQGREHRVDPHYSYLFEFTTTPTAPAPERDVTIANNHGELT